MNCRTLQDAGVRRFVLVRGLGIPNKRNLPNWWIWYVVQAHTPACRILRNPDRIAGLFQHLFQKKINIMISDIKILPVTFPSAYRTSSNTSAYCPASGYLSLERTFSLLSRGVSETSTLPWECSIYFA